MIELPPIDYITVPAIVVYSKESPAIKDTFLKLLSLAYDSKKDRKSTSDLYVDDVITFLCLARRTYFLHIEKLCELSWLLSSNPRPGFVRFSFPIAQNKAGTSAQNIALNKTKEGVLSAKSCTKVQKVALEDDDEEDLNLIKESSSSSSSNFSAKSCTKTSQRFALLRAAGVLPNHIDDILRNPEIQIEDILAMLAFCYDPVNKVNRPGTILGMNLSAGYQADATYYNNFTRIPIVIFEKAGLDHLLPPKRQPVMENLETPVVDSSVPEKIVSDSSVNLSLAGTRYTPGEAWAATLSQLQVELPKSTFDAWVAKTQAVRFIPESNRLIIGAPNAYAREWLTERLSSTARRLLVGMLNRNVEVQFEVYQ